MIKSAAKNAKESKPKKAKKAEENGNSDMEVDTKSVTQAAKLASPTHCQQMGDCTDITQNADLGTTVHMTPHRKWIHDLEPCRVPV